MAILLNKLIDNIVKNDHDGIYTAHIAHLGNKRPILKKWAGKNINDDKTITNVINIAVNAVSEADVLLEHYKQASEKQATIFLPLIVKTLKIASKALAVMLLTSPLKVGVAYSALHVVIKEFEKRIKDDRKSKGLDKVDAEKEKTKGKNK